MVKSAIILGAFRGVSYLDITKSYPSSLKVLNDGGRVLDWILADMRQVGITDVTYVGGHHIEKVVQNYPGLKYLYDPQWEQGDIVTSLSIVADNLVEGCIICSPNIIFRKEALEVLFNADGEIVYGYDALSSQKVDILRSNKQGSTIIRNSLADLRDSGRKFHKISDIYDLLIGKGAAVSKVDLSGLWAPLDNSTALARFIFGTKAETLDRLKGKLKKTDILDQISFSVSEWNNNRVQILNSIKDHIKSENLVVRSSSKAEDCWICSNAGRFKSILNVDANCSMDITNAIDEVVKSYTEVDAADNDNHILVQPQLKDIVLSGVLLTRDLESGAPYYVINAERASRTNGVTSGSKSILETYFINKYCTEVSPNPLISELVGLAKEVEGLVAHDSVDIEFAIDKNNNVFLLQARPLVLKNDLRIADSDFVDEVKQVRDFLGGYLTQKVSMLAGRSTLLGIMPDWNPAEMIGVCPHPLALSMYQRLITDQAWSLARSASGYNNVWPEPLIISLSGRPYVDIRTSLNSFLPKDLPFLVADKLVDAQIDHLNDNPDLHDKLEFDVAMTCMDFNFERYENILNRSNITSEEKKCLYKSILLLTDNILTQKVSPIGEQICSLAILEQRREVALGSQKNIGPTEIPRVIWNLFHNCLQHGVVPFSILARYCFISMAILRSLEERQVFSSKEIETLLLGIPTIASEITCRVENGLHNEKENTDFINKYGHLRPSSYDISSLNYAQAFDKYFRGREKTQAHSRFATTNDRLGMSEEIFSNKRKDIEELLKGSGFQCTFDQLKKFIFKSIPSRELLKFEFMKNVNSILELTAKFGEYYGFEREDMAYLPIDNILRMATDSQSCAIKMEIGRAIGFAKKRYVLTRSIRLPHLIDSIKCLDHFKVHKCRPNFVTNKKISAELVCLNQNYSGSLEGKIVLLENADPGYDWLFSHKIAGLITVHGGVASHMAIRAAEFGLPSAIGCGELIYESIRYAKVAKLDCAAQIIRRIS